jgi:hypothetical protein
VRVKVKAKVKVEVKRGALIANNFVFKVRRVSKTKYFDLVASALSPLGVKGQVTPPGDLAPAANFSVPGFQIIYP